MKIKYVEIENILSIKSIRLDFEESGLVLLDGWNFDDDTANGAGKTAVFNSIAYGIFGKFARKISASDILRSGTKSGSVKVGIEAAGSLFEVYRARPNSLKFYIDGLEKDMTQEEFEGHIRMTYTQYLISMYSAQTEGLKLISMNDSGKKDFFLQLLNLDAFDECRVKVMAELSVMYAEESLHKNEITALKTKIEVHGEGKVDVSLMAQPDQVKIGELTKELEERSKFDKPDTDKIDALKSKIDASIMNLHNLENESRDKKSKLSNLMYKKKLLEENVSEVECPHCSKTFCLDNSVEAKIAALIPDIDELSRSLEDYPDFAAERLKYMQVLDKCKTKRESALEDYNKDRLNIHLIEKEIARLERVAGYVKDATDRNHEIDLKIEKLMMSVESTGDKLSTLMEKIKLHESVQALFSPTGAPAYVLDSAVDVFNDKVYQYASMIWPNANYQLQSFKENKNGDVKAKFSEKLTINGKDRSIGALSGGEYRCLSLAVDFAVVDVLEVMFGISINPIMLDEPFNDLDASNRERVLELLDKVSANRQIWVIDHASEAKAMFSNIMKVGKRSGISSLVI